MQYMLLIHDDPSAWAGMSEEQVNAVMGEYFAYSAAIREEGIFVDGNALKGPEEARTVRVRNGSASSRTARSPRPRSSSAATTSSIATRSTRRSTPPRASRARASARSRCARSRRCEHSPRCSARPSAGSTGSGSAGPSVSSRAASATSIWRRKACRTRSPRRSSAGRAMACRTIPARGSSAPPATARSTAFARRRMAGRARAPGGRARGAAPRDRARARLDDPRRAARTHVRVLPPAARPEASVALTLRLVAGLTVEEVARALLTTSPAISQRLVRAKRTLREGRVSIDVPADHELPERLGSVLAVVYLVFNEGHSATAGDAAVRAELCAEAIRLARVLAQLMPDESEARGLLALCLATDARRAARYDAAAVRLAGGSRPLALRRHSGRRGRRARARNARAGPRPVCPPGRHRVVALARAELRRDRLGADRLALRPARARRSIARDRAQPRPRRVPGRGPRSRAAAARRAGGAARRLRAVPRGARPTCTVARATRRAARAAYARAIELTDNPGEREFLERRLASLA